MIKFKISAVRFAEACSILEYLTVKDNRDFALRLLPRFVVDDNGEYIIKVNIDSDGDIAGYENAQAATIKLSTITPKRSEQLLNELMEAAKTIVNPPNAGA